MLFKQILPPCNYCYHPWLVAGIFYHEAMLVKFTVLKNNYALKDKSGAITLFFKRNATFQDPFFTGDPGSLTLTPGHVHFVKWNTLQSSSIYTLPKNKRNFPCCISFEGECILPKMKRWKKNCLTHWGKNSFAIILVWSSFFEHYRCDGMSDHADWNEDFH